MLHTWDGTDSMNLQYLVVFLALGITGLVALTLSWDAFWREVERKSRGAKRVSSKPDQHA